MCFVVLRGLEPRQTEPKSDVLPLHHRTMCGKEWSRTTIFGFSVRRIDLLCYLSKKPRTTPSAMASLRCPTLGSASIRISVASYRLIQSPRPIHTQSIPNCPECCMFLLWSRPDSNRRLTCFLVVSSTVCCGNNKARTCNLLINSQLLSH